MSAEAVESIVIPVLREELDIRKQRVTTGTVQIRKVVHEREEFVSEPAIHSEVEIERIPVNKVVVEPPPVRQVGNTTIYSLVEEVIVVSKHYLVKEEVRVTQQVTESTRRQPIILRTEELLIERGEGGNPVDWIAKDVDFGAFKDGVVELAETREEPVVSKMCQVVEEVVVGKYVSERRQMVKGTVRRTDVEVERVTNEEQL